MSNPAIVISISNGKVTLTVREVVVKTEPVKNGNILVIKNVKTETVKEEKVPMIENIAIKEEMSEKTSSNIHPKTNITSSDRAKNERGCCSGETGRSVLKIHNRELPTARHIERVPLNELFHCSYCKVTFSTNIFKESHKALCATKHAAHKDALTRQPQGGKEVCPVCDKRFALPSLLKNHMVVHSDEKPFKCDLCSYTGKLKQNMVMHRKQHFTESKLYTCRKCGNSFKAPVSFKKHLVKHIPQMAQEHKRSFCRVCGKELASQGDLMSHRKRAHRGNIYACDICGAAFSMLFYVTVHKRVEHKRKGIIHESLLPMFACTQGSKENVENIP